MRRSLLLFVAVSCVLAVPSVAGAKKIPGHLRGKIFFSAKSILDVGPSLMVKRFAKEKPKIVLKRGKAKVWEVTIVAFLKRAPYPGPVTIWWYDKADKASFKAKEPVHVESVKGASGQVFSMKVVMDPNIGFNKKHAYWIHVGQIIGKRHRYYARGLVSLER
ncbi:MAG: hypothetical protein KAI47_14295 [Deltaproteobacteria bacterium]|nr:hypothetical protein [Deltaproteobacteria bacterium]